MKFKTRLKSEERPSDVCSVSRCKAESTVIDGTHKLDDCNVHLCDRHWQQMCDDEEAEYEAKKRLVQAMRLKPGQSFEPVTACSTPTKGW